MNFYAHINFKLQSSNMKFKDTKITINLQLVEYLCFSATLLAVTN